MPESTSAEQPVAASAPSPSVPSAPTPSTPPGPPKSTLRQVLEAVVDLAAIAVAGGLAWVGKVDGNVALVVVSLLAGVRVSDLVSAKSTGGSGPAGPGAGGIAGGVLWLLGHLAPRAQHAAGLTVLGLSLALLTGCSPTLPADLYRGVGTGVAVTASGGREVALLEARDCLARESRTEAEACLLPWRARWAPIAQAWQGAASRAQSLAHVVASVDAALERRWPAMDAGASVAADAGASE